MNQPKLLKNSRSPWSWIPTLYSAEGIPYTVVTVVSVVMYKMLGISNADIAFYTSLLNLPWALKPLWGPIVDNLKTKRWWILVMQFIMGILFACIALTLPTTQFFKISIAFLWLVAFMSATHDIAADGFYMIGLDEGDQALYNGVRSSFYRIAMLLGQGVFVILVSVMINASGMEKVTVEVSAVPSATPQTIPVGIPLTCPEQPGELHMIFASGHLNIPIGQIPASAADSIRTSVRTWNIAQGQPDPDKAEMVKEKNKQAKQKKSRSSGLEQWLERHFGVEKAPATDYDGNMGIVSFCLSKAPEDGKTVIVTFTQDRGDRSIKLVEGTRFEFTSENWNKPVKAVIQLDKKLNASSKAYFDAESGNVRFAWSILFYSLAVIFLILFLLHRFTLPNIEKDRTEESPLKAVKDFFGTFSSFFKKDGIALAIAFLLLFRLGESQLVKLSAPFMLDTREAGGLGLTAGQYGLTYGTIGLIFLLIGGLLGGWAVSKFGLKKMIWWFAIMINLPDAVYILLSYIQPSGLGGIIPCVAFETFGYGFGFTAYQMFMIYISRGKYKTSHFAICTAFMSMGMMIPGMISGWLQEIIGYQHFFIWVVLATIPGFILLKFLKIDPEFGKKVKDVASNS